MPIHPDGEALTRFSVADLDQPVVMLNLLRFAERADGIPEGGTGRDAYEEYGRRVAPLLAQVGGEVRYSGGVVEALIGERADGGWDEVLLVHYPSRRAFLEMIGSERYLEAVRYRTAALADSRLIATTPSV